MTQAAFYYENVLLLLLVLTVPFEFFPFSVKAIETIEKIRVKRAGRHIQDR